MTHLVHFSEQLKEHQFEPVTFFSRLWTHSTKICKNKHWPICNNSVSMWWAWNSATSQILLSFPHLSPIYDELTLNQNRISAGRIRPTVSQFPEPCNMMFMANTLWHKYHVFFVKEKSHCGDWYDLIFILTPQWLLILTRWHHVLFSILKQAHSFLFF